MTNVVRLPIDGFNEVSVADKTEERLMQLERMDYEIATLVSDRKKLIKEIVTGLELATYDNEDNVIHVKHDGQKSENIGRFTVTFVTKSSFSVNSKHYEFISHAIPADINPVRASVSYRVNNSALDSFLDGSTVEQQELLSQCLSIKYSIDVKLTSVKR